jgi:hypothetical protein
MRAILSRLASLFLTGLLCLTVISMPRLSTRPLPYTLQVVGFFSGKTAGDNVDETTRALAHFADSPSVVTTEGARAVQTVAPASTGSQQRVVAWALPLRSNASQRAGLLAAAPGHRCCICDLSGAGSARDS